MSYLTWSHCSKQMSLAFKVNMIGYEDILTRAVQHMLTEKNVRVDDERLLKRLVMTLHMKVQEIGKCISVSSCHAGRSTTCYFDVERTFRVMGIRVTDLKAIRNASLKGHVTKPKTATRQPTNEVSLGSQRDIHDVGILDGGNHGGRHIPRFLPPFPGLHTYQTTREEQVMNRDYMDERTRLAKLKRKAQKATNAFYQRTMPTLSLFKTRQRNERFKVLKVMKPNQLPCFDALMPPNEILDLRIYDSSLYDSSEQPIKKGRMNPYLREPIIMRVESDDEEYEVVDEEWDVVGEEEVEEGEEEGEEEIEVEEEEEEEEEVEEEGEEEEVEEGEVDEEGGEESEDEGEDGEDKEEKEGEEGVVEKEGEEEGKEGAEEEEAGEVGEVDGEVEEEGEEEEEEEEEEEDPSSSEEEEDPSSSEEEEDPSSSEEEEEPSSSEEEEEKEEEEEEEEGEEEGEEAEVNGEDEEEKGGEVNGEDEEEKGGQEEGEEGRMNT
ncbi:uncharacterized protein LOC117572266 [Drosophila albomicans]|uniref:Transcription initiation factor TFIID subunit 8 n=1 Tax=Drosophila albomicans TaxID=7291 RepID=A0A6P8X3U8_DROAB|nr:uncharacterized protein LOC117572266 [Drosophila albomicans]